MRELAMRRWIGAAVVAGAMALAGPVAINPAAAASSKGGIHTTRSFEATELGGRRRARHHIRYAYRPDDRPYYYDRPDYYRPYPYVAPVPFFLGFGFGPRW
jgi:hypothetical protein